MQILLTKLFNYNTVPYEISFYGMTAHNIFLKWSELSFIFNEYKHAYITEQCILEMASMHHEIRFMSWLTDCFKIIRNNALTALESKLDSLKKTGIIYLIYDKEGWSYIGSSTSSAQVRYQQHLYSSNKLTDKLHLRIKHCLEHDIEIYIKTLEQVSFIDRNELLQLEKKYIQDYRGPYLLNEKLN